MDCRLPLSMADAVGPLGGHERGAGWGGMRAWAVSLAGAMVRLSDCGGEGGLMGVGWLAEAKGGGGAVPVSRPSPATAGRR